MKQLIPNYVSQKTWQFQNVDYINNTVCFVIIIDILYTLYEKPFKKILWEINQNTMYDIMKSNASLGSVRCLVRGRGKSTNGESSYQSFQSNKDLFNWDPTGHTVYKIEL